MLLFVSSSVILLILTHVIFNYSKRARLMKNLPGPKLKFLIGNGGELLVDSVGFFNLMRSLPKTYSRIYRFWSFNIGIINIYDPIYIEKVISNTKHNEKSFIYSFLKFWLGDGLLLSQGQKWQDRRKILTPAFHFDILHQFCEVFGETARHFTKELDSHLEKSIDVVPLVTEYTLNSTCETAMGTQLCDDKIGAVKAYKNAIYKVGQILLKRFLKLYYQIDFLYNFSSLKRAQDKFVEIIHSFTLRVIKDRKEYIDKNGIMNIAEDGVYLFTKKKKRVAMLDLLILAEKEGIIDMSGIREEVDTFMFEGHDTTASGLTFCLMLLANHESIQNKIFEELEEIFGDSTRSATMEDLSKMKYLERCIKESLRLYPPVPFVGRQLNEEIELDDYKIPKNVMCHIHIYDLHRRADLYEDPEKFDPDRFLPENSVGRHPYAYIPFSAGPRNCIGQKFAVLMMKSVISAIIRQYKLLPVTKPEDIVFLSDLVLRSTKPVYVKFQKRK